jgi:hypothetical protein
MTTSTSVADEIKAIAAELRKKMYGERGYPEWGTKFVEIEERSCEMADAIGRELMEQLVAEQAKHAPHIAACYACGRPTCQGSEDPHEPRSLETSRGDVGWLEPRHFCRTCRQAFFPSVPSLGVEG